MIGELAMIRLCMRIGRCPDILEIPLYQGRLIFRERLSLGDLGGSSASAEEKGADNRTEKLEVLPINQSGKLLTVIHKVAQVVFFNELPSLNLDS